MVFRAFRSVESMYGMNRMSVANRILSHYATRLSTKRVVCEPGLTPRMPDLLTDFLPPGRWLLVVDENTWKAQGESLANALRSASKPFDVLKLAPSPGRDGLVCDSALVEQVIDAIGGPASGSFDAPTPRPSVVGLNVAPSSSVPVSSSSLSPSPPLPLAPSSSVTASPRPGVPASFSALVAVGSGTICDTVKLAASATGLPSAAVATATSMNGYPSVIAAVLRRRRQADRPRQPADRRAGGPGRPVPRPSQDDRRRYG